MVQAEVVPHYRFQATGISLRGPRSTDEVLSQAQSHLQRNSELFTRGDSPEPKGLDAYRTLDLSRGGSPTNDYDIVTASDGQAPFRGRKRREDSCMCTGVEGPNGVFTYTRSGSSSRAQEARSCSDSSKAKTKKAKGTACWIGEIQQAFPCV